MVEQIGQIACHAFCGRRCGIAERVAAMAAGIPAENLVLFLEFAEEGKPLLMAGRPAMQHDERGSLAGNLDMNLGAVIGNEM